MADLTSPIGTDREDMPEAALHTHAVRLILAVGGLVYHTHDSRRSAAGYPDLSFLVPDPVKRGTDRHLYRELKTRTGKVSPEQSNWMMRLRRAGVDVDVWRPADLLSGRIAEEVVGHRMWSHRWAWSKDNMRGVETEPQRTGYRVEVYLA